MPTNNSRRSSSNCSGCWRLRSCGKQSFLNRDDENHWELQPLRRMHGHQRDTVVLLFPIVGVADQRHLFQESLQPVPFGMLAIVLAGKRQQFLDICQSVRRLLRRPIRPASADNPIRSARAPAPLRPVPSPPRTAFRTLTRTSPPRPPRACSILRSAPPRGPLRPTCQAIALSVFGQPLQRGAPDATRRRVDDADRKRRRRAGCSSRCRYASTSLISLR